jgi:hypothetical protein
MTVGMTVTLKTRSTTMVAKSKDKKGGKEKGQVKAAKPNLQKVTVRELTEGELDKVQGGLVRQIR